MVVLWSGINDCAGWVLSGGHHDGVRLERYGVRQASGHDVGECVGNLERRAAGSETEACRKDRFVARVIRFKLELE